jgi:fructokinase
MQLSICGSYADATDRAVFSAAVNKKSFKSKYKHLAGYQIQKIIDTAGAGDWCSAGIIHYLNKINFKKLTELNENIIVDALNFGQALAALSCQYEGPRGMMYNISKNNFKKSLRNLIIYNKNSNNLKKMSTINNADYLLYLCPNCEMQNTSSIEIDQLIDISPAIKCGTRWENYTY